MVKRKKPKKKKVTQRKVGRPTKYQKEYAEQTEKICLVFGADDKKIAEFFKVAESTINKWKLNHPEFSESIKKGKDKFDTEHVEAALLKRALGYTYIEAHKENYEESSILKPTRVVTKAIKKEVVPDVIAQIFWLKNRHPARWQDKQEHEHGGFLKILHEFVDVKDSDKKDKAKKRQSGNKSKT